MEMKFDPMTGEPIQAAREPEQPEMKFDPMTGEPIQAAREPEQPEMKFDPMTGQPVQAAGEPEQPEMKFDPMTGQPVQAAGEPEQPEMKFDPMTGQPVQAAGEPEQPEMKFDPMTGQPVQPGVQMPAYEAAPVTKKKSRLPFGIGIVVAVIAVGSVAFAGVKNGAFLGKSGKVALATANTFTETSSLTKTLKGLEILNAKSCTMDLNLNVSGDSVDVTYVSTPSEKQVYGNVGSSDIGNIEFVTGIDSKEVKAQIPLLGDDVYVYNYKEEKTGYLADQLDQEDIKSIDELCNTIYSSKEQTKQSSELTKIFVDQYKSLKFKSVAKETFEVNGKDRKCKGYQTTVTEDELMNLTDELEDYCTDQLGDTVNNELELRDWFDEVRDSFDDMPDTDITFYIYKNKLACIDVECGADDAQLIFHGGDRRTQNMELVVDGKTELEIRGEKNGKVEDCDLYVEDNRAASLEYDYEKGDYELNIMNLARFNGTLKNDRDGFRFTYDGSGVSVDVKLSKGAELKEIEGDRFDIGNASESELESIFANLYNFY